MNNTRSSITAIDRLDLGAGRAESLRALLAQFSRSEWLPAEAIEEQQLEQLNGLLAHAFNHVPIYRVGLQQAGWMPGARLTRELWGRIPVLERAEVQQRGHELRSAVVPQAHGFIGKVATSGSTGMPIEVFKTDLTQLYWQAVTLRDHAWHARDFGGTLAGIRWYPDGVAAYPEGLRLPDWGPPVATVAQSGPSCGLSVTASTGQQAEWLARMQPDYLVVFPSLLPDLIRECAAQGITLSRLRQVRTVGECLDDATRALCRKRWGVPVQDVYSAHEVGYIALECPQHEHYHIQSECARVEVLDAAGRACRPGEIGRVVVTPLHNYAMPLVRYALGDYAEVGAPCPCGRGLPVLRRILGRQRNMLTLPDGGRVWPRLSELKYNEVLPVTQFQMAQKELTRLEVRLVALRRGTPEEERRLRSIIVERLGYPFEVAFAYPSHIPRSAGGKFEDFQSELAPPGGAS